MSRRYWFIVVAFGLIVFPLLGQAQDQSDQASGKTNQESHQPYKLPFTIGVDVVESKAAAEARERHESEARQREKDDLVAQKGMNAATQEINTATQAMATYAYWSTALVGLGTALLFLTLYLTYQANQGAQAAVDVTRQIGEAQVRAYVQIDEIAPRFIKSNSGESDCMRIFIYWKNTGQSPTRRTKFGNDYRIHDALIGHDFGFPLTVDGREIPIIGAGQRTPDVSILIDTDALKRLTHDRASLLLWGAVEYNDIFIHTSRHRTEFAVLISDVKISGDGTKIEFEIDTYDYHNGADEECLRQPVA